MLNAFLEGIGGCGRGVGDAGQPWHRQACPVEVSSFSPCRSMLDALFLVTPALGRRAISGDGSKIVENVQQRAIPFVSLECVFKSWPRCTCLYVQQSEPAKRRAMLNCRGASKYIAHASSTCLLECPTRLEMLIVYSHTKRIRN